MEGADICQITKNCRTSVGMIEKYYAMHIKSSLDAAAIMNCLRVDVHGINRPRARSKGLRAWRHINRKTT